MRQKAGPQRQALSIHALAKWLAPLPLRSGWHLQLGAPPVGGSPSLHSQGKLPVRTIQEDEQLGGMRQELTAMEGEELEQCERAHGQVGQASPGAGSPRPLIVGRNRPEMAPGANGGPAPQGCGIVRLGTYGPVMQGRQRHMRKRHLQHEYSS